MLGLVLALAVTQVPLVHEMKRPDSSSRVEMSPYFVTTPGRLISYLNVGGGTTSTYGVTFTRSGTGAACTASDGGVTFPGSGSPCVNSTGLHMRPQIADLLTYSSDLTQAAWSLSQGTNNTWTVTANAATAPDGTSTADRLHAVATGGSTVSGFLRQTVTLTAGSTYEASFYVKNNSASTTDANYWAYCFTTAAQIIPVTSYFSQLSLTQWKRVSFSVAVPAGCTGASNVGIYIATNGTTANGIVDVLLWGSQLETGSFANDFCPSGSSATTCNAETAKPPKPSGMSLTAGCVKACFVPAFTGANPLASVLSIASGATDGTARLLYVPASGQSFGISDGTHTATVAATFTAGTQVCAIGQWDSTAGTLVVKNATAGTSGSASSFTGFSAFGSTLELGSENGGSQPLGSGLSTVVLGSGVNACN